MSSLRLAAASSGASSRSNRNSAILASETSSYHSHQTPSTPVYKRIGSSENLHEYESRHSSYNNHHHHQQHHSLQQQQSSASTPHTSNSQMRMSSSLTIQHDPSHSMTSTIASSHPNISKMNNKDSGSSLASSTGSSGTQYYQHMTNNHAQNGSDLIAIKCKFEAEFRRFSLHRSDIKSMEDFQKTIEHFHKLFNIAFSLFYIDPLHGDLLPISNDINFKLAIGSAKPLLRLVVQRKGNPTGFYPPGAKKSNFLGTLLPSSGSSASSKLARLQISAPEDFRQVSSIIDVDIVPETCRRVRLVKHGSDKPLGFYIRDGTSVRVTAHGVEKVPGIFISRLIPGGLAESTGLLAVNDEVLEVNGIEVSGKSLDQVTDMMVANSSNLIITIRPANQRSHGTLGGYSSNTLGSEQSYMTGSLERVQRPKKMSESHSQQGMDYHNAHYHHGSGRNQNYGYQDRGGDLRRNAAHRHSANIIPSSMHPPQHRQQQPHQYSSTTSRTRQQATNHHSQQQPNSQASLNRHSVHIGAIDDHHSVMLSTGRQPPCEDDSDDDEDEIRDHFSGPSTVFVPSTASIRSNDYFGTTTVTVNQSQPHSSQSQQQLKHQQQQQQQQLARTPSSHSMSSNNKSQHAAAAAAQFIRNSLRDKNHHSSHASMTPTTTGYENVTYGARAQQQQQQQQTSSTHSDKSSMQSSNHSALYMTPASSTSSSPVAKTKLTSTSIFVNSGSNSSGSNHSNYSSGQTPHSQHAQQLQQQQQLPQRNNNNHHYKEPNENDIVTL